MLNISMKAAAAVASGAVIVAAIGTALAAQDKYTVKVPGGLAFSEFRGFESWQTVAVSHSGNLIEVILGDPAMIQAYAAGIPGNGKPFPDGVRMAKIHWNATQSKDAPAPTTIPDTLHDVDFMMKDGKRFTAGHGWGYAQFNYSAKDDAFAPLGTGPNCGVSCHELAKKKDYVFTAYGKR